MNKGHTTTPTTCLRSQCGTRCRRTQAEASIGERSRDDGMWTVDRYETELTSTQDTEVARAEVSSRWMRRCTSPLALASCDRAINSPNVCDRIEEILWHDKMTGKNSRSERYNWTTCDVRFSRITIILAQIDKGTWRKERSTWRVARDTAYYDLGLLRQKKSWTFQGVENKPRKQHVARFKTPYPRVCVSLSQKIPSGNHHSGP